MATAHLNPKSTGRKTGLALLASIIIGIASAAIISQGIDINMTADVSATAENMLEAEQRLRGKAYIALLLFGIEVFIIVGLYRLLRKAGTLLAGWSLLVGLAGSILIMLGAVFALNAAEIASNVAYNDDAKNLLLASLQATSDYTSFHLGLVLSTAAKAGFFYLFIKSGLLPKLIAGWGLFASLFVVTAIVARDFIPALGSNVISGAFMISNLTALLATGLYLSIKGIRSE